LSTRFNSLVGTVPGMLNSAVSAHRVRELVDLPRETHNIEAYEELKKYEDEGISVKLKNVTFGYSDGGDKFVYKNAEFEANPGEIVAVIAASGGGKTTLMKLLLGMLDTERGSVMLAGKDGKEMPINADLRKFFSYVPQGNTILSGTIADNMRMVREDVTDEEIISALKTACAYDFVSEIEGGINGKLGERGRGVSEGQAQRISIARAIVRNSPILLLDEATSALDVETEERLLQNIIKAHPNKVIIISTHRPSALKLCSRIYRIADGGTEEIGIEKAGELILRYADMPIVTDRKEYRGAIGNTPLAPKEESEMLSEYKNEGWWNE
ncbi:MAG: ABC transporter ATP-binding protein, partial [Clostridia bacterium]|nr:ABC transporter ATP-binding protein [Clostridia bacterium]